MMSPYRPPTHPVPDNIWHTFLIAGVAAFLVWMAGTDISEILLSEQAASATEQAWRTGNGHALSLWIEEISEENPAFLWNRILGLAGWALALGALARFLMKGGALVTALPSVLVLALFPGVSAWMVASGLLGLSVWCVVRALRSAQWGEENASWYRGGIWLGVAACLHPVWILPALLFFGGLFEAKRRALIPILISFLATFVVLFGIGLAAGGLYGAAPSQGGIPEGFWNVILTRHVFLLGALVLMLAFGATRRGIGWWCLTGSLFLPVIALFQGGTPGAAWVPLLFFVSIGLAKLPTLLDIRHPRAYLSILLCQLLLWLPAGLDPSSEGLFEELQTKEELSDEP